MTIQDPTRQAAMRAWFEMIEGLAAASDWADDDPPIEIIQTHISAVLLGKRHALKLKKPVDFGFLDYTTLEKRRLACEAEVTLNRRLCPEAYLGVRPVVDVNSRPRLSREGKIIDYGVWMKRLPSDRMLDQLVAKDEITQSIIDRVAERMADFHQRARRGPDVDLYGQPGAIRRNWEENFAQTAAHVGRTITTAEFDSIRGWTTRWMESSAELLERRVSLGFTCDGHGDMRCESICITDGICVFDCIEFNERFRCGDVASEVAFLAMDLDARGRPDLGYYLAECYNRRQHDPDLFRLLPFYRCYRAYVRGKVLSFRLDEREFSEAEQSSAAARAKNYFHLARRYASPLEKRSVILVAGLSGTGKTSLARAIAGELGLGVVSADAVRKSIFGGADQPYAYGEGPYSAEANRHTYEKLIDTGRGLLGQDGGVILDATFRSAAHRALAGEMADRAGANFRVIECRLAPDLIRPRLERRAASKETLSAATWATYLRQCQEFDPIGDSGAAWHLPLDTTHAISVTSRMAADWLRSSDSDPKGA